MPEQIDPTSPLGPEPLFSVVTAVHNVERFLDAFTASLDAQTFSHDRFEIIAVDDGSTDASRAKLETWSRSTDIHVTVVSQENAGQGEARNRGIGLARGRWVTFPDPDDWLADDYLARVSTFIERNPTASMVATSRVMYFEAEDRIADTHPLVRMFGNGDQLVDLRRAPHHFHGSAPAAFVRREILQREAIAFDPRIRPNFEDGHFCCSYLLATEPLVGFVGSAKYYYRKRQDGSSTLQRSREDSGRYLSVPRYGYLDVLRQAAERHGEAPGWLQTFVLYELSWYFEEQARPTGGSPITHGEVAAGFLETLALISTYLQERWIESFNLRRFDREWRDILLHGFRGEPWHTPYVVLREFDGVRREQRIVYRYAGEAPTEELFVAGARVTPTAHKSRAIRYYDRTLLRERIAWVPVGGELQVWLDGAPVELRRSEPPTKPRALDVPPLRPADAQNGAPAGRAERLRYMLGAIRKDLRARERLVRAGARTRRARGEFQDAWTFMDRVRDADDNAERLFRYVRTHEPSINAWFVLDKRSPDWARLTKDGFGDRLVHYGSTRWTVLMLHTRHLISSHVDRAQHDPQPLVWWGPRTWDFTFLQHGVIKDDISRWLNTKRIDLFVTSTPGEHESVVGDDTGYKFTTKEAKLVGLARFDRLRELGAATPPAQRDLILVAPTWRSWLMSKDPRDVTGHSLVTADFFQSEFASNWLGFLKSDELARLARSSGKTVAFLPHPNLQPILDELDLPAHVQPLTFHGEDVQQFFARSAAFVTDYSSMAFNAAYIDRPVLYFQFDYDRVMRGGHTGREDYFQYGRDGFGPVAETLEDAIDALGKVAADGWRPSAEHDARIDRTFPERDGGCCARTVAAVRALEARGA
ncbi:glycosyl transferase family 2 [Beutenbergia cavernae DSM 12333]|uniref:Glycosyl transferase family 2 n=1 Tax=Beutenbergia cavernae (strain ATCC BAA-8 / DSM 12333 / CCUG 43141 / JCM 11478 / NBRC 16432 / NCIMB 13614 / HKI 0122) TaxID=471853 RepID=C5C149_BEUC1|nr:glycosyltransferase [Beutenbergia cavernae]ACQ79453.1 glycosyl transferase family 2 [Beutenbergia cavernae DSM 12333]